MPVHAGITILTAFLFFSWSTSALLIVLQMLGRGTPGVQFGQDEWPAVLGKGLGWILGPVILLGLPFGTFSVRMAKHLHRVPEQLKTFEVQNAACFCCENGHKHPDTGADIPCDRELVYRKLEDWYGSPTDIFGDEHLRRFNSLVHHRLGCSVLRQMPHAVPIAPLICMLSAATMPWLADAIERILWRIFREDGRELLEYSLRFVLLEWAFVMTVVLVIGLSAATLSTVLARRKFPTVRDIWLALLGLTVCAVPVTVVAGTFFVFLFFESDAWPATVVFIVALLLAVCLLRLTLTNQHMGGAAEEVDGMSEVTSTTPTPQQRADLFPEPDGDDGFILRLPSDVSIESEQFSV
ncbi:unnamed protein product [Symbiodinium sp. CCMP2456]|nr:unnamed protein product [Symbiodinium sp. CCMP2456]